MSEMPRFVEQGEKHYVASPLVTTLADEPTAVSRALAEVQAWLAARGVEPAGPPFVRYRIIDMPKRLEIEAGFPVSAALAGDARVIAGVLPAGRYATMVHRGPLEGLADANAAFQEWADAHKVEWQAWPVEGGVAWGARVETYLSDPKTEPDARNLRTEIAYQVAESG